MFQFSSKLLSRARKAITLGREVSFERTCKKRSLDETNDSSLQQGKGKQKKLLAAPSQGQAPTLKCQPSLQQDIFNSNETKSFIGKSAEISNSSTDSKHMESNLLSLPQDVLINVMSYLTTVQDRQSCITVCSRFQQLRNCPLILSKQMLESHPGASFDDTSISNPLVASISTVSSGILRDAETSLEAFDLLYKFASAGNVDAVYM